MYVRTSGYMGMSNLKGKWVLTIPGEFIFIEKLELKYQTLRQILCFWDWFYNRTSILLVAVNFRYWDLIDFTIGLNILLIVRGVERASI